MTINIETAIAWMSARQGKVTYSMDYRNGPSSYDCSSAVYYALMSAGAITAGWAVNTEYEHDWLIKNGYTLISENQDWDAQRGDIFIWGVVGRAREQEVILVFLLMQIISFTVIMPTTVSQ